MPHTRHTHVSYPITLSLAAIAFLTALTWLMLPHYFGRAARPVEVKEKSSNRANAPRLKQGVNTVSSQSSMHIEADDVVKAGLSKAYGKLPLSFEANQGQTDEQVKFLSRGNGYNLFLSATEAVLALSKPVDRRQKTTPARKAVMSHDKTFTHGKAFTKAVLRMNLVGADPQAQIVGENELPGKSNYFIGNNPEKWRTNIAHYSKAKYENVYPGIDLVYYGNQQQLEYDFTVAPGIDPHTIKLGFDGADKIRIDAKGDLVLHTNVGDVRQHKPQIYQEADGVKQAIAGRYVREGENEISFAVGAYDANKPLTIDPQLSYSTYLGGSQGDAGVAIAVDALGQAYVTGTATSVDFPLKNATQSSRGDAYYEDVFVTKLTADGSALVYSTFLGGIYGDDGDGIAVDANGSAYVTGPTGSPDYPTISGGVQSSHAGIDPASERNQNDDVFVTKLSPDGSALVYSTYLGGTWDDVGNSIAVNAQGEAYVTGETRSSDFRTTPNAYQATAVKNSPASSYPQDQYSNVFVSKLKADGAALLYSTYIGGSSYDRGNGIALDDAGNAYVTGAAYSLDFPITPGAARDHGNAFVVKLNAAASGGASRIYSTYSDAGSCIALDRFRNAYVAENALSAKLDAAGKTFLYSVSIGGGYTYIYGIAADAQGNAFITGSTSGVETTSDASQRSYGGGSSDAFVMKLKPEDGATVYSTYVGGSGRDYGLGIALDTGGNPYITGTTISPNFPTSPGAFQTANRSGSTSNPAQGFVTKLAFAPPLSPPLIFVPGIAGSLLDEVGGGNLWLGSIASVSGLPGTTDRSRLTLDPYKKQFNVIATDVIRKSEFPNLPYTAYEPLLDTLTSPAGGYREYKVKNNPALRTTYDCDMTQKTGDPSTYPNLFVFAYDWRKSGAENAAALKDYMGCVQRFYPDSKADILTHSMGSLIARRYILDNPGTHNVNKMITIAAPWLGAPKAIYTLESGKFFANPFTSISEQPGEVTIDYALSDTIRDLVEFFPGVHQLLPSEWYFRLGGRPFSENKFDINRNGVPTEAYTYGQLTDLLDKFHPRSTPGSTGLSFHDYPGQDNWQGDWTGVDYYHIYGEQKREKTIGQVTAVDKNVCNPSLDECAQIDTYDLVATSGDGTVPLLSARRLGYDVFGNPINLNASFNSSQDLRYFLVSSPTPELDKMAEHGGLTRNPAVHSRVLSILRGTQQSASSVPSPSMNKRRLRNEQVRMVNASFMKFEPRRLEVAANSKDMSKLRNFKSPMTMQTPNGASVHPDTYEPMQHEPSYYLTLTGIGQVSVADANGNSNAPIDPDFARAVPGVDIYPTSNRSVQLMTATDAEYTVKFQSTGTPFEFEIIKGVNNRTPTRLIRYMDKLLPSGIMVMLKITPQGVEDLRYDRDGDGIFETIVPPTVSVAGAAARDLTAPVITFSEQVRGDKRLLAISATDNASGVKTMRYSLDGRHFQLYTQPLKIDTERIPAVYVFADDSVGNRSGRVMYRPLAPIVAATRDSSTGEIIVTATVTNMSTASVTTDFMLDSARLNGRATTSTLPQSIGTLAPREVATIVLRFPSTIVLRFPSTVAQNMRGELSGTGTSHGEHVGGAVQITIP